LLRVWSPPKVPIWSLDIWPNIDNPGSMFGACLRTSDTEGSAPMARR
jgi:hypothetical protein